MPLLVTAGLGVAVYNLLGPGWSVPLWFVCLVMLYLYRDPHREIPSSPLAVVSPADGTVITTAQGVIDPYLQRPSTLLEIEMNRTGVYGTRSPVEGKVLEPQHVSGGEGDRPQGVWLKTDEDDDVVIAMHRGPLNNLPRCLVRFGERVGQGQRCGYIEFGGRIEVYLPKSSRIEVQPGSRVRAGSDVIATLLHR